MNHITRFFTPVVALGAAILVSCGGADTVGTPAPSGAPVKSASGLASQVGTSCNQYRTSKGKSSLTRHSGLDQLALQHAQVMARTGKPDHADFHKREGIAQQQYRISRLHENVVRGGRMDRSQWLNAVMTTWKTSTIHRQNLLSNSPTHYGIAATIDGEMFNVVYISGTMGSE